MLSNIILRSTAAFGGAPFRLKKCTALSSAGAGAGAGAAVGLGLGLIFRSRATSGGSDIIAMILSKYSKLPVGQLLILVDSTIVLIGLATFKDWRIPLYSWMVVSKI